MLAETAQQRIENPCADVDLPTGVVFRNPEEMVAGDGLRIAPNGRRRGDAEHVRGMLGALDRRLLEGVIMAVQDQVGAGLGDNVAKAGGVDQALMAWCLHVDGRVVEKNDAQAAVVAQVAQRVLEARELTGSQFSDRLSRAGRDGGRQPDERDRPAAADEERRQRCSS